MSGAGESPRVPPNSGIQAVHDAADAAIRGASKRAARLGGDGEIYPEDVAIPVPIRGGLIGKAPYSPTPEQKPQIDAALRRQMSEDWPTIEPQTRCWPPKPDERLEQELAGAVVVACDPNLRANVDWPNLAYRLARIPKAREAIFAAMDVEGRPWRWADTVVITLFALVFMAAGAAVLAIAAKVAS